MIHPDVVDYGKRSYWDERYRTDDGCLDWYVEYDGVRHLMEPLLLSLCSELYGAKLLTVGCGNSTLGRDLVAAGFHASNVVNTDYSSVVIEKMTARYPDLTFQVMDVTRMSYDPSSFDAVIDKGTLDAVIQARQDVGEMMKEVVRVLKPNGLFIQITHAIPEAREHLFQTEIYPWNMIHIHTIPKPNGRGNYHMFVLKKHV